MQCGLYENVTSVRVYIIHSRAENSLSQIPPPSVTSTRINFCKPRTPYQEIIIVVFLGTLRLRLATTTRSGAVTSLPTRTITTSLRTIPKCAATFEQGTWPSGTISYQPFPRVSTSRKMAPHPVTLPVAPPFGRKCGYWGLCAWCC